VEDEGETAEEVNGANAPTGGDTDEAENGEDDEDEDDGDDEDDTVHGDDRSRF